MMKNIIFLTFTLWIFSIQSISATVKLSETHDVKDERLYVSTKVYDFVTVIYPSAKNFMYTIPIGKKPAGVEASVDNQYVYVSSFENNTLSVIETATNIVAYTIAVGSGPDTIAVNPLGNYVYVANVNDNTVSIINLSDNQLATIPVGDTPQGIAVYPDGSKVYVANYGDDSITIFDSNPNTAVSSKKNVKIPFGMNHGLVGITINPEGNHIYLVSNDSEKCIILSSETGELIDSFDLGLAPEHIFIPKDQFKIFISNFWSSSFSVIISNNIWSEYTKKNDIFGNLGCPGRMTGAIANHGFFYVTDLLEDTIVVVDGNNEKIVQKIACPRKPLDIDASGTGLSTQHVFGIIVTSFAGQNQIGIKDANIYLTNSAGDVIQRRTDIFGHFVFHNVPEGIYTLKMKAKNFLSEKTEINILSGKSPEYLITPKTIKGDISGNDTIGLEDAIYILQQLNNTDQGL